MSIRTRFAPSPTGHLHVGNARTALFNALFAARTGGTLILRIEDTDAERSRRSFEDALIEDLRWLGLSWQEGPDGRGDRGPYRQSERGTLYAGQIARLEGRGLVYPCFCTPTELALSRKAQLAAGRPPRYAGTCAHLERHQIEARLARGLKPALRFRVPARGETVFEDLVRGRQRFAHQDIGDFVIQRADGSPAFFFSNAVDDALMQVTHVLRGEDHLANTPRQLLLLEALDLAPPSYGHLPLILGEGGAPLSKREGGGSLAELRADGILPETLRNYLARLGHNYADNGFMDWSGLAQGFELAHIGQSPAHFDHQQLGYWQHEALQRSSTEQFWEWLATTRPQLTERVVPAQREAFISAVRGNLSVPDDALHWADVLRGEATADNEAAAVLRDVPVDFFRQAMECLDGMPADFRSFTAKVAEASGRRGKALYMPLRAALTGRVHGPEMEKLWVLLPDKVKTKYLRRLLENGVT